MALLGRRDILFLLSSSPNLEASRAIDSYCIITVGAVLIETVAKRMF